MAIAGYRSAESPSECRLVGARAWPGTPLERCSPVGQHARLPWGLLAVVAIVILAVALDARSPVRTRTTVQHRVGGHELTALPLPAQGLVSATLGQGQRSYAASAIAGRLVLRNPGQRLVARFDEHGVEIRSARARLDLSLVGYGYANALRRVASAVPRAHANRVEYARGTLREWYVNGPLGLEQGFTLNAPPHSRAGGPLTLALALSGNVRRRLWHGTVVFSGADGESLNYCGLVATDATGRRLPARIELLRNRLLIHVDDARARYPVRIDPFFQHATLTTSDGAKQDEFGTSVAISGDTIVAGAPSATVGGNAQQGVVYVFVAPANGWANATETAKLTASDGAAGDYLGISVAISGDGDTIVAGAPDATVDGSAQQGAVYVFRKPAGGWTDTTETAKLTASDGATSDELGGAVAISDDGNTIVAGALYAAAAYVFVAPAGGWTSTTERAKLTAPDGGKNTALGTSVGISGGTIVVGAPGVTVGANSNQGALYVFVEPAGGWISTTQTATLTASDGVFSDNLGDSVAIAGDTIVAGAPDGQTDGSYDPGAAYVFVEPAGAWTTGTQTAKLTASNGGSGDFFGDAVAVSGATIVVGADARGAPGGGAEDYVFAEPQGGWTDATETSVLTPADAAEDVVSGTSVAISGDTILANAADALDVFNTTPVAGSPVPLTVTLSGAGSGTVVSDPAGINCPGTCTATFAGNTEVTLTATAGTATPTVLAGWTENDTSICGVLPGQPTPTTCTVDVIAGEAGSFDAGATFQPFTADFTAGPDGSPTGNDTVAVFLSACADYGLATLTWSFTPVGGGATQSATGTGTTCAYATDLAPGDWTTTLDTTSASGLKATDTQTVVVLPEVQFYYEVEPSVQGTSFPVPVVVNACGLSSGADRFIWKVSEPGITSFTDSTSGCSATWPLLPGASATIQLEGIDNATSLSATTSSTVDVFAYNAAADTASQCSLMSISADACWRQDAGWTADVLSGQARAPDYMLVAVSGGALGAAGSVYADLTCDGNLYLGVGGSLSIGSGDGLSIQALAGWGWVGDPTGAEPLADWVDSYVDGLGAPEIGVNLFVAGVNFTSSPGADGPKDGIEYYASTPGLGVSIGVGDATGVASNTTPGPNQYCPAGGVIDTPLFKTLSNIVNPPNHGFQTIQPPSGTSPEATVDNGLGGGAEVYILSTGWLAGSQTQIEIHSTPVSLGKAIANDTGQIGQPVLIPSRIRPGHHEIIITGRGPNGNSRTVHIPLLLTAGAHSAHGIRGLTVSPKRFRAASRGASIAASRKTGATVSYKDSRNATTTFTVLRAAKGFSRGGKCVAKRPARDKKARSCTLYKSVGSFSHTDTAGRNAFHFTGRVRGHKLTPGAYRLQATPRAPHDIGATSTTSFGIVQ